MADPWIEDTACVPGNSLQFRGHMFGMSAPLLRNVGLAEGGA
jgi:hypothetical protein